MISSPKKYIETGSFMVSERKPLVLEVLLGSCAGVAIVDKKAGVGGLYHILLPAHPTDPKNIGEDVYAGSGLPRFLKALKDAGCAPERMQAAVAGGALIGKLSPLDLALDIGGRTIEIAQQILGSSGVPVVLSETGGFFGSRLQLDLKTLEFNIEPAYASGEGRLSRKRNVAKVTQAELTRAVACVKPIPQIALKIIRTFQSDDYDVEDIASQIRRDQVISAKVLNICNSVYVSAKKEIKSINQALVVLGSKLVVRLILSSLLEGFFDYPNHGYSMSKGGMYHHAVSTALVSEQIAAITGKAAPEVAYTGGLLHDIGKVLLDQYVASAMPQFYRKVYSDGNELLDVEKSILGIDHSEAGLQLAELWSFPPSLRDVIGFHSRPENAKDDPDLTHVVYLANLLLSRFDIGREMENVGTEKLGMRLSRLGLDLDSLMGIIGSISWKSLQSASFF